MTPKSTATEPTARTRALIYTRASLDVSGERQSVERQHKACVALAAMRDYEVVAELEDNSISAYSGKTRPGWEEVLGMVKRAEVDVIIAWHLDRVTRSMGDLEYLIDLVTERGVAIITATGDIDLTTDVGRMVARILAAVARAEVERKAERQKLANEARASQGLPFKGGPRSFGYEADGITINPTEADAIRYAASAALDGMTLTEIAAWLSERGFVSSRSQYATSGTGWSLSGVRHMLTSPRYIGLRVHKGQVMGPGVHEPILDERTHEALVRLYSDPTRDGQGGRARNRYAPQGLLSLIARCGVCDDVLVAGRGGDKPKYRCRSKRGCVQPPRMPLDSAVIDYTLGLLTTPGFDKLIVPTDDERVEVARRQIDKLYRRLAIYNDDFNDGVYDDNEDEYRRATSDVRTKINAHKATINKLSEIAVFEGLAIGTEKAITDWGSLPIERQRAIVAHLVDVTVTSAGRVGRGYVWTADECASIRRRSVSPAA